LFQRRFAGLLVHLRLLLLGLPVVALMPPPNVLRMLVTGGPPVRGGGGIPHRISTISVPVSVMNFVERLARRSRVAG